MDRATAGQPRDRLVHHRLKDGERNILIRRSFIQKRLNIRLRKDPAAGCDRIDPLRLLCELSHPGCIHREERRHAVDEGPRPTGARAIHALIHAILKIRDLLILAPELVDDIRLRVERLHRLRLRQDLLTERKPHHLRKSHTARAGDRSRDAIARELLPELMQKYHRHMADIRHMTLIPAK